MDFVIDRNPKPENRIIQIGIVGRADLDGIAKPGANFINFKQGLGKKEDKKSLTFDLKRVGVVLQRKPGDWNGGFRRKDHSAHAMGARPRCGGLGRHGEG